VIRELHGNDPGSADVVWRLHAEKIGLSDADIADDDPIIVSTKFLGFSH
jgi:hypothetical protein